MLQSNCTIEIPLLDRAHAYQNSFMKFTVTVHRTGYANRTNTPTGLCASLNGLDVIEWYPAELKDRTQSSDPCAYTIKALVPSTSSCRQINFTAAAEDLTQDGHVPSTSSESFSLFLHLGHDAVPDFSTYYRKLVYRVSLTLRVKPDPSEPWDNAFQKEIWENTSQRSMKLTITGYRGLLPRLVADPLPVNSVYQSFRCRNRTCAIHYLSNEARQPYFVHVSNIGDLCSMSPEERDLSAPLAHPFMKVFAEGEELCVRYSTVLDVRQLIYVGDTWTNKVLPMVAERHGTDIVDQLSVVQ